MQIPEPIMKKITDLANARDYDVNDLIQEYYEILSDDNLSLISFGSEEEKYDYAFKVLLSRTLDSVPVKTHEIIPIGFSGLRKTKKGEYFRIIYVIVKKPKPHISRITCMGKRAIDIIQSIELFNKYNVRLGEFSDGSLTITPRTRFINPEPMINSMDHSVIDKLMSKLGVRRVTIAEAPNNKSRVGSDGYVDDTDWRVIRGFIVREYVGTRKDNTPFGTYTIIDDTIPLEDKVLPDGRVIPPGFTVWVAPELMKWEGECDFYGTIEVDQDGEAFMNAFYVIGVHAVPRDSQ